MAPINVVCLYVHCFTSKLKQACLLHDMISRRNVRIATESKLNNARTFSKFLAEYEKVVSPYLLEVKEGIWVLYRKNFALLVSTVFIDPECNMVVFNMNYDDKYFR